MWWCLSRRPVLGLKGTETCAQIEENKALTDKMEAIRAACTVKVGMAATVQEATEKSAYVPFFAIVSKPADYTVAIDGHTVKAEDVDVVSRLSFMLHMHKRIPHRHRMHRRGGPYPRDPGL